MEDFIKDRSSNFKLQPKAETWERIEAHLSRKRKRRMTWLFSGIGVVVLLASFGLYYTLHKESKGYGNLSMSEEDTGSTITKELPVNPVEKEAEVSQEPVGSLRKPHLSGVQGTPVEKQTGKSRERAITIKNDTESNLNDEEIYALKRTAEEPGNTEKDTQTDYNLSSGNVMPEGETFVEGDSVGIATQPELKKPIRGCWSVHLNGGIASTFYESKGTIIPPAKSPIQSAGGDVMPPRNNTDEAGTGFGFNLTLERDIICNTFGFGMGIGYHKYAWTSFVGGKRQTIDDGNGNYFLVDSTQGISGGLEPTYIPVPEESEAYDYGRDTQLVSSLSYWTIPLYVKWQPLNTRKFSVGVITGVGLNLLSSEQLVVFDTSAGTYITGGKISRATTLDWMVSARLGYKIAPAVTISLEPVFRRQMQPFVTGTNRIPLDPKATWKGLNIGLNYTF